MRRVIVLTTLLLLSPVAAAGWGAKGDFEPSTGRDTRDGYMWQSPPQTTDGAVYFNGWLSTAVGVLAPTADTNPNVAGQKTAVFPPQTVRAWGLLGVWLDCNKDGYIGYGDQGLYEYPVQLLSDNTLCKPVPPPAFMPAYGYVPTHNDGKWVHEFIPLGWEQWRTQWDTSDPENEHFVLKASDDQPFDFNDTDARVWIDFGLPEARTTGGSNCYINPQPRGTFQSTGGLVESADCFTIPQQFLVTDTLTANSGTVDSTPAGQLSFKDKPRDQSDSRSALNQKNPWGVEEDPEYVDTWDCSQPQTRIDDPSSDQPNDYLLNVSQPKVPSGVNANGKPAGQVNATEGGFDECKRSQTGANDAELPYILEGDVTNSAKKIRPSDMLTYNEGFRRGGPFATLLGAGTPYDLGVRATGFEICATASASILSDRCHEGFWEGNTNFLTAYDPILNDRQLGASNVITATFYAHVGSAATSRYGLRFPGTTGSYGAENCALPEAVRLFECDATKWWPADTMPRSADLGKDPADASKPIGEQRNRPYGVKVGQPYQLRDVDCWDHSTSTLREEVGVHWGTVSNSACP